tara:strand:- start:1425 stop:1643 length:219 start_codon:yes stop_codon:yes gene_type:complete
MAIKGRPAGTGGIYKKRETHNKQVSHSDRQTQYITHLSKSVGEACDRWLDKKGLKGKSWKKQNDEMFKKKVS